MHEHGLGTVLAGRFQKVDCSDGVHLEVEQRDFASLVVRGLRRTMNDDVKPRVAEQAIDRRSIADVDVLVSESTRATPEAFQVPGGIAHGAEEMAAHVVVDANNIVFPLIEVEYSLRANKATTAGDDYLHLGCPESEMRSKMLSAWTTLPSTACNICWRLPRNSNPSERINP